MLINKITTGFVIQTFDTETKQYTSQNFVAGDNVDYEKPDGSMVHPTEMASLGFGPYTRDGEPYLPFDMIQPHNNEGIMIKPNLPFGSEQGPVKYKK